MDKYFGSHEFQDREEEAIDGPSDRKFAYVFAAVFALIGAAGFYKASPHWPWWVAAAGAFGAAGFLRPSVVGPLNRLWMKLGIVLYSVVSPVVLALVFYLCVTPIGFLMQLSGKDPLRLRFDPGQKSYWILREPPGPAPESLKNQY